MQPLKKQKPNPTTNRPNVVVLGRLYLDEVEEWTIEDVAVILLRICSPKVVNILKQENKLFNGEAFLYIAQHGKKIAEETDQQYMEEIYQWIKTKIGPKLFTLYSPEETMKVLVTTKSLLDSGSGGGLNREHYVKYFFPKLDGRYLGLISKSLRLHGKETTLRLLQNEFKQENNDELSKIITWVELNNYIESQYFPTITQLLNQMKKLNETPLPYRFVKFDMIYVERKQALESYFKYLDNLHARSSDPKEKGATVMFIGASPGVGKSRFAYQLHKFIEIRYSKKEIQNLKMINLVTWFSNGGNFTGCELDGDKPIDLMRSIVTRIIYSYIVHVNRHSWLIDIPINESVSTNLDLISSIFTTLGYVYRRDNDNWLVDVFKWIEGNEKEEGKKLWIHFTLDEYNQIIRSLPTQTSFEKESIFDECINLLSDVPFFLDCHFSNLLSGTHIQSCKNLKSAASNGGKVFLRRIELNNFDKEEENQIYCNQKFPNSVTLKLLFNSFGGHARLIGQFDDNVGLPSDQILGAISKVIISQDRGSIMIGLEENISVLEIIISLCITRFPINIDKTLDSFNPNSSLRILQRSMILFFKQTSQVEPTVIVSIPLVVLFLLVNHIRQTNNKHFLASSFPTEFKEWLDYGIGWENFERFNYHFLNIRMKCFKLLHDKGIIPNCIDINLIFPTVNVDKSISVLINDVDLQILNEWYPSSSKNNEKTYTIYKNGKGADFADIFMVLCSSTESKVLFYVQVRHTDRVNTSVVDKRKEEEETITEVEDEYKKLEKYKEQLQSQWGNDLTTHFIIITNRTISDDMEFPCIGRDLFVDYFGSFAQVVSYLNVTEIPFMDMSLEDFSFITKTSRAYTFTNIRSNWKFMNDEQRAKMLANSLTMPHLKNLFPFVKEKPIVASAIELLMTRSHISPSEI